MPVFSFGAQVAWSLFLSRVSSILPQCQLDDDMITRSFRTSISTSLFRAWTITFVKSPSFRPGPLALETLGIFLSNCLLVFPQEFDRLMRADEHAINKAQRGPSSRGLGAGTVGGVVGRGGPLAQPLDASTLFSYWFFLLLANVRI